MSIYITKDGKKRKLNISATDVQVLDIDSRFKKKNLESVINELSDTEHIHIGEVDSSKDGIWIDDGEILDNSKNNGVVERLKTFVNETIGELSSLTTSIKSNLVGAINELKGNVDQLSNPNLLINGDFQVWQRGTSFNIDNSMKYTTDRWRIISDAGMKLTQEPYGVRIETTSVGRWHNFEQYIELPKYLKGKKVTVSIKLHSAGVIKQFYAGVKSQNTGDILFLATEFNSVEVDSFKHTFEIPNGDHNLLVVGVQTEEKIGARLELEYIKLELGSVATPFIPRTHAEELALCKRYFERLGSGDDPFFGFITIVDKNIFECGTYCEVTKRVKYPTITFGDASQFRIRHIGGASAVLTLRGDSRDGRQLLLTGTTANIAESLNVRSGHLQRQDYAKLAYIDVDSEIY